MIGAQARAWISRLFGCPLGRACQLLRLAVYSVAMSGIGQGLRINAANASIVYSGTVPISGPGSG
jgi:hypothetical protein